MRRRRPLRRAPAGAEAGVRGRLGPGTPRCGGLRRYRRRQALTETTSATTAGAIDRSEYHQCPAFLVARGVDPGAQIADRRCLFLDQPMRSASKPRNASTSVCKTSGVAAVVPGAWPCRKKTAGAGQELCEHVQLRRWPRQISGLFSGTLILRIGAKCWSE